MAAKQLMLPANRAFNSNGLAISGAQAKLYLSGGLTPANFFADSGLVTSLGATLTANGAGRFPTAYGDSTVGYRLRTLDSDGAILDDIDPYFFGLTVGVDGANASIAVGTTTTGAPGSNAAVSNSGTGTSAILNFTVPGGATGPAGDVAKVTDRTALAALTGQFNNATRFLAESGREGLFVWSPANNSANVTKDPQQGIYVALASDATGSSGSWTRIYTGAVSVTWFGAKGDGATDDHAAIQAAIDFFSAGGGAIFFRDGIYRNSAVLTSKAAVRLYGNFIASPSNGAGYKGATIQCDTGVAGFLNYYVTNLTAAGSPTIYPSGNGTILENIRFLSVDGGASHAGIYGIESRARIIMRNVEVREFGDHGIVLRGSVSGGDGVVYGNVSESYLEVVRSISNGGAGIRISGNDANQIKIAGGGAQNNTGYGLDNDSFVGITTDCFTPESNVAGAIITRRPLSAVNTYIGIDTEGGASVLGANDTVVGGGLSEANQGQTTQVHGLLHAYDTFQVDGNATIGVNSSNAHGINGSLNLLNGPLNIFGGGGLQLKDATNSFYFHIFNDGTNINMDGPVVATSYKIGGTTVINTSGVLQAVAFPALTGDVTTTAGSLATTLSSATVVGKLSGQTLTGKLTAFTSAAGAASLTIPHGVAPTSPVNGDLWTTTAGIFWRINSATVQVSTGGGTATGTNTGDQTITLTGGVTGTGTGSFATVVASVPAAAMPALTGDVTTSAGAVATTVAKINGVALSGLATGILKNTTTTGVPSIAIAADFPTLNQNTTGSAATLTTPRTLSITGKATAAGGTFNGSADLAINVTALTVDGAITPTSCASTGAVTSSSATAGIGYASGSRGTVTQATSKATGATSNTVVTDITLNAAALASATTVSFVFTNSAITANDTLILNHVTTGTFGSYTLNAHGFSAGSCTIDVRNISAGSLSEAIVIRAVLVKGG